MSAFFDGGKARGVCERALRSAKSAGAPEATAILDAGRRGHLRFAANTVTTSGEAEIRSLALQVAIGLRAASGTTEDVSPDGVDRLAEQVVATAKQAPENPEHTLPAGPQEYPLVKAAFDPATAEMDPKLRVRIVQPTIEAARQGGLVAAGFYSEAAFEHMRMASTGAFGSHRTTRAELSGTLRSVDGASSGWASSAALGAGGVDAQGVARRALERVRAWKNPVELPPGAYTVVIDSAALSDLMPGFLMNLDARAAEEGRSAFSKQGGTSRVGETLFADSVTLTSDPADALAPGFPWGEDGFSAERVTFVEKGMLKTLRRSRYWGQKTGTPATITGGSYQLAGTRATLEDLISGCDRGLLVTHIWYVRMLEPKRLAVTGLTRDATLLIEKGQVTRAVKNFRFNQSLVDLFKNVEAVGRSERTLDGLSLPSLRVRDFHMSSISEAV